MDSGHVARTASARQWFATLPDAFAALWAQVPATSFDDRTAVELAVTEIAGNVLRHTADPDTVTVRAELTADAREVRVVLEDTAPGVPLDLDRPMPGPDAESGRGLAIVRACVDVVEHHAGPAGSRWVLSRRPGGPPATT
ncbi:ATP-binding protein [Isoptericola sp. NPDC057191]|uniref:ATP-binding protein n=1 Tax=Isoptericola sp. NPDC057191 TaxID=3346041 RepID=UPI003639D2D4